jgi:hypothetical protein
LNFARFSFPIGISREFGEIRWKIRKFFGKKKNPIPRRDQNPRKVEV